MIDKQKIISELRHNPTRDNLKETTDTETLIFLTATALKGANMVAVNPYIRDQLGKAELYLERILELVRSDEHAR